MSVTIVVGGQYGGEGKGKIVSHLAMTDNVDYVVRCGGPNSGHTVDFNGKRCILRLLPAGFVNAKTRLLLAAGALINPDILLQELRYCKVDPSRLGVDFNTGVITKEDEKFEKSLNLRKKIGSTLSGVGAAVARRVLRNGNFRQAKDEPKLHPFLTCVSDEINSALDRNLKVIVEGTQGFGLSLYHSKSYPYTTSRDTTASAFLSEVGVSPLRATSVIMVLRTFPIRVGGSSGPLKSEITWRKLRELSGYPYKIREFTTVTNRLRRVALFDINLAKEAATVNNPTEIALNGVDYLDYQNKGARRIEDLTWAAREFIDNIQKETRVRVSFVGTGPTNEEIIDTRNIHGEKIVEQQIASSAP
jgi:adenylosuccinate synthase